MRGRAEAGTGAGAENTPREDTPGVEEEGAVEVAVTDVSACSCGMDVDVATFLLSGAGISASSRDRCRLMRCVETCCNKPSRLENGSEAEGDADTACTNADGSR